MKWVVALLVLLATSFAAAETEPAWSTGVSPERRAVAKARLDEGNELFVRNQFRDALVKYEEALASWDHPAIRFNAVRCLIALERPLDALLYIDKALAYGEDPFESSLYTEAVNYQRLLVGQIAELEVSCTQRGATVKLDGELLVTCPGSVSRKVLPGTHVIVGELSGHMTSSNDVIALPGKKQNVAVTLKTIEAATVYRTRWKTWQPWAVAGVGAAIALGGVILTVQANNDYDRLQKAVDTACAPVMCSRAEYIALDYSNRESSAIRRNRIGLGLAIGGAAVVAAGVVGVILNGPRAVVKEQRQPTQISPVVTPSSAGLSVQGAF